MLITVTFQVSNDTLHRLAENWGIKGRAASHVEMSEFIRELVNVGIQAAAEPPEPDPEPVRVRVRRRRTG